MSRKCHGSSVRVWPGYARGRINCPKCGHRVHVERGTVSVHYARKQLAR